MPFSTTYLRESSFSTRLRTSKLRPEIYKSSLMTCKWLSQTKGHATAWLLKNNNKKNSTCVWFLVYFVSTSYRYIRCDEIVLLPITLDCRQGVRETFMKGQGVQVRLKVKNHWTKRLAETHGETHACLSLVSRNYKNTSFEIMMFFVLMSSLANSFLRGTEKLFFKWVVQKRQLQFLTSPREYLV